MSIINEDKLRKAIEGFAKYVVYRQKGGNIDFYYGFMQQQEGYKRVIYNNAHNSLKLDTWNESKIGTGYIEECVVGGLNAKDNHGGNNIVVYQNVTKFHNKAIEDLAVAEDILYRLYCDENPKEAFEDAMDFWGKWYPELSYLMFIRDCDMYLPVKPSEGNHRDRFRKLGISVECLEICSWENYQMFIYIHQFIQSELQNMLDKNISLLDAHSFVWQIIAVPDDFSYEMDSKINEIKGGTEFVERVVENSNYKRTLEKERIAIEEAVDLKVLDGEEREQIIKRRVNQGTFRKRLINRYSKCCLCGVTDSSLLVASHIQPWSRCEKEDKLVVDNGLLLCPNHDFLFDKGWITFAEGGSIVISDELQSTDRIFMNACEDMQIDVLGGMQKYLEYHRNNVFENWKK